MFIFYRRHDLPKHLRFSQILRFIFRKPKTYQRNTINKQSLKSIVQGENDFCYHTKIFLNITVNDNHMR